VQYCTGKYINLEVKAFKVTGAYTHTNDNRLRYRSKRWVGAVGAICDVAKQLVPFVPKILGFDKPSSDPGLSCFCPPINLEMCEVCATCAPVDSADFSYTFWLAFGGLILDLLFFLFNVIFFICFNRNIRRVCNKGAFPLRPKKRELNTDYVYRATTEENDVFIPPPPLPSVEMASFRNWQDTLRK